MSDNRSKRPVCRSKEGLETDIPMRALVYGEMGENIRDSDDFTKNGDKNKEDLPLNFIKVDD